MRIYQKTNKKLIPVIAIAVALLVATGGYFTYAYLSKSAWPFAQQNTTNNTGDVVDGVNYSPPTEEEVKNSQNAKTENAHQDTKTTGGKVSVGIAFAGYDEQEKMIDVRAFTPDVIEGDGTCTATLSLGSASVSQSAKAFIDSSSTQCEPILIPVDRFATKGEWSLVVSYTSSKNTGVSPVMPVEVQ